MPTYNTPTPIDLAINLQVGAIEVVASDRADTVVTVSPTNPAKAVDRRGAEETKVDFDGQRVTIIGPAAPHQLDRPDRVGRPEGRAADGVAVHRRDRGRRRAHRRTPRRHPHQELDGSRGRRHHRRPVAARLARQRDRWAPPTAAIEITADHGQIRVGTVTGDAILKASHGTILVDESGGDLDAKLSYGDLEITKALASVAAKTAYGSIQLREVSSGSIQVESGFGQVTIGVRPGVPAWLDLSSKNGHVRNQLAGDRAPDASEQTVAVRARTQDGDITIQRAR